MNAVSQSHAEGQTQAMALTVHRTVEEWMRELAVSTCTTMDELAAFINSLPPDQVMGGRPGPEGVVTLYACSDALGDTVEMTLCDSVAARVAIEVVLQQVMGMPGAGKWLANISEQFEGGCRVRAGWLAPPLTVLARIHRKTVAPLSAPAQRVYGGHLLTSDSDMPANFPLVKLAPEQVQALESLIGRLMTIAMPGKVRGNV